ncbi:hypothetical protein QOT17_022894 [Balamuthia mandrillaris]
MNNELERLTILATHKLGDLARAELADVIQNTPHKQFHLIGAKVAPEDAYQVPGPYLVSLPPISIEAFVKTVAEQDAQLKAQAKELEEQKKRNDALGCLLQPALSKRNRRKQKKKARGKEHVGKTEENEQDENEAVKEEGAKAALTDAKILQLEKELRETCLKLSSLSAAFEVQGHLAVDEVLEHYHQQPNDSTFQALALTVKIALLSAECNAAEAKLKAAEAERDQAQTKLNNLKVKTGAAFCRNVLEQLAKNFLHDHRKCNNTSELKCSWPPKEDVREGGGVCFRSYLRHLEECSLGAVPVPPELPKLWWDCCDQVYQMSLSCIPIPCGEGLYEELMAQLCKEQNLVYEFVELKL